MKSTGQIKYPPYISELSAYIGRLRDMYNLKLNQQTDKFNRGDRSGDVNVLGVKGELIFAHYLWTQGIEFVQVELVAGNPLKVPDFVIGDTRIDIKTIRPDAPDLLVNYDAHNKEKEITHYVFIQDMKEGLARYWIFPKNTVSKWPVKNVRYSNAYYKIIPEKKTD